jgi:response regulator receiver domain-containing protein
VSEASDGAEAMHLWRQEEVDLVITDLHMPDKNGLEVIMELRAFNHSVPIIAMSDGGRAHNTVCWPTRSYWEPSGWCRSRSRWKKCWRQRARSSPTDSSVCRTGHITGLIRIS